MEWVSFSSATTGGDVLCLFDLCFDKPEQKHDAEKEKEK
jgi:hypothetical protein